MAYLRKGKNILFLIQMLYVDYRVFKVKAYHLVNVCGLEISLRDGLKPCTGLFLKVARSIDTFIQFRQQNFIPAFQ